jgi:hypothetical protein
MNWNPEIAASDIIFHFEPQNGFSTGGQDGKDSQKKP